MEALALFLSFVFTAAYGVQIVVEGVPDPETGMRGIDAALIALGRISATLGDFWAGIAVIILAFVPTLGCYIYPSHSDHRSLPYGMLFIALYFGSGWRLT